MNREYLEFYVVLMCSGALTPRLFSLEKGDPLWLGQRFSGMFTLDDVADDKHVVLIGTGTGLIDVLCKEGFREYAKARPGQIHIERYW